MEINYAMLYRIAVDLRRIHDTEIPKVAGRHAFEIFLPVICI
jgi:hypothetical protein